MSILNRFKFYVLLPARVRRAACAMANGDSLRDVREVFALDFDEEIAAGIWSIEILAARH